MAKARDQYSNKAYGTVTESAQGTLTFTEISTNVNIFDKVAWVVNRLEWYIPPATLALCVGGGDYIEMALCASNNISTLALNAPSVIDLNLYRMDAIGTPASALPSNWPLVRSFENLPGGGLIIAPRPLYVGVKSTSIASAATVEVRMNFRQIMMTPDEYIELIDFYRIVE